MFPLFTFPSGSEVILSIYSMSYILSVESCLLLELFVSFYYLLFFSSLCISIHGDLQTAESDMMYKFRHTASQTQVGVVR